MLAVRVLRVVCSCAPLGLVCWTLASAQPVPVVSKSSGVNQSYAVGAEARERTFRFDAGVELAPGLEFGFTRGVPSVAADGSPIAPHQPRFAPPITIASDVRVENVRQTSTSTIILASGVDADGVTPMLVVRDSSQQVVDVFWCANDDLLLAEQTGVGRTRTNLASVWPIDILGGASPLKRYEPKSGAVCHGLIVLVCSVSAYQDFTIGVWPVTSTAIVVSQDRGATWSLVYEDEPSQQGLARVRAWSMQNWCPSGPESRPTEAWFIATDYRFKPFCEGGAAYFLRATRQSADDLWTLDTGTRIYQTPAPITGQHAHAAAVVPGPGGPIAIVSIGDGQALNRVVRLTPSTLTGTAIPWESQESFHGSEGTPGNQFVGCAPLGATGLVILGSDLADEQIMLMDPTGDSPRHMRLFGGTWSNGITSQVFMIRSPRPELSGPYCATYDPQQNSTLFPPHARRLLYSEDGLRWAHMLAPGATTSWTASIHGDHVYIDGELSSGTRLRRATLPRMHTAAPLDVSSGMMQRLRQSPTHTSGGGGTLVALTRNAEGLWVDEGVAIDPQPPCVGPVWKATGFAGTSDTRIGDISLISSPTFGQTVGVQRVAMRFWTMGIRSDRSTTTRFELKPNASPPLYIRTLNSVVEQEWQATTIVGELPIPAGQTPVLRIRSGSGVGTAQSFYLALDAFAEGRGYAGYPAGPDTSLDGMGTAMPDERAWISGFDLAERWTVTIAGRLPDDGWDLALLSREGLIWPLFSLWCSDRERLVFVADSVNHTLEARIIRENHIVATYTLNEMVWTRGSSLQVSVSQISPDAPLGITVAGCGMPARDMALAPNTQNTPALTRPVRQIRFDDGSGIDGIGIEMRCSPMLWFGGSIVEHSAWSPQQRREALRTLHYLAP
ncbi:MAG: hypothetical protein KF912_04550 [Phycisphaeraceae bacterium]|nr:hypothetical protein [Phycisphaeraceae bacterium]